MSPAAGTRVPYYADGSFSAALYDIVEGVARPAAPEAGFYRALAAERLGAGPAGPILDLGAGTGRIALPLAEAGYAVHGLELSQAMLAVAEGKRALCPPAVAARLRFLHGDMRAFDLGCAYDLAIVPFRGFNFLLTPAEQAAFLACLRRHLAPGGHAVIDTLGPPQDGAAPGGITVALPGTPYRVGWSVTEHALDPERRVATAGVRHVITNAAGAVLREQTETLRMRWTEPDEFRAQLAAAGLRAAAEYGGTDRRPAEGPGDRLWLVAAA